MSGNKGKRYERKLCNRLRGKGFKAERIRGSGGGTGTRSGDVLFVSGETWPDDLEHAHETRGTDRQGWTIARLLEQGRIDDDIVWDGEVKFDESGHSRVYREQMRAGMLCVMPWQDQVLSCGMEVFPDHDLGRLFNHTRVRGVGDVPELTTKKKRQLTGSGTAKPPDFLFVRRSKDTFAPVDWVVLWRDKS